MSAPNRVESIFRDLFESAPDATICADATGRIVLVNAQAARLFGYGHEELLGENVRNVLPEAVQFGSALKGNPYFAVRANRRDGTEFPAEISLGVLESDEEELIATSVRDLTERQKAEADRHRVERQRQQAERMESLGQLAGGVAHDFNNLLAVIDNYAHFVAKEVAQAASGDLDRPWESIQSDLEQVQQATERAVDLTHCLLAFGRHGVVRSEALILNDVVTAVEPALRRSLGRQVALVTRLAADLWSTVADPSQIESVLTTVLMNARDAMPDGGTVTIETANLSVDDQTASVRPDLLTGRFVRLRVSDTGVGMNAEVLRRAFEPFFSTKPKGPGTGLGLATVHGIITQAEGHVEICSEPEVGTTLTALFPATDRVPGPAGAILRGTADSRNQTVLVAEEVLDASQ